MLFTLLLILTTLTSNYQSVRTTGVAEPAETQVVKDGEFGDCVQEMSFKVDGAQ